MPLAPGPPDALSRLQPDLLRLARHLTGDAEEAQDLSQEVLLKLWMRLRAGQDIRDLRAYAVCALRNTCRQARRDRQAAPPFDDIFPGVAPDVFAHLALQELEAAIARLPANQARLIRLVAEGETSPADLARLTGWPKGTVMSRLARARAQLRADMGLAARAPVAALI